MLTIRDDQLSVLREVSAQNFQAALVEHAQGFAPRLATLRGEQALQQLVGAAFGHARAHGFDLRGPVRFWVEMSLAHGLRWFDDPQLVAVTGPLADRHLDQLARAERVHQALLEHLSQTDGEGRSEARRALRGLLALDWKTLLSHQDDSTAAAIATMRAVHPRRAEVVGQVALQSIAIAASAACRALGLDRPDCHVLLTGLMFGFGHGVLDDPMYPWVRSTLEGARATADRRCEALARKTRRYIRATLGHWAT